MPGEIDDLLEAMFRKGLLGSKSTQKKPAAESQGLTLEWETAAQPVSKERAALNRAYQETVDRLTRDVQTDMAELEKNLKEDGMESGAAANTVRGSDLDTAFAKAREETAQRVLGQEEFLDGLTVALKRPFVAGSKEGMPLSRCLVRGGMGTGRHTALSTMTSSLGRQGVLKSPKLSIMDLSRYAQAGSDKLFCQDLYAALKSGACGVVFENFEDCHVSVLALVSALFREGEAPLPGRYAEQKGMLVEIGGALVPGAVSTISAAGKYLFLLTEKSDAKVVDALGMPFLACLEDICETGAFRKETINAIAEEELKKLCKLAEKQLDMHLTYEPSAVEAVAGEYSPEEGAFSLSEATAALYKALSEAKLRQNAGSLSGQIVGEDGALTARCGELVLRAVSDAGDAAREAAIQSVKKELEEIVGLKEIKEYILSLEDNFKIQQLRREKGLKADSPSMHMIFTGNPGTGKTTVARIVSRYLKAIGVLTGGQLVEVTRADLVGQYVGHTAPLTQKAIQSALGGVLFIDEAYSLFRGRDDSFGLEAIDTLVKGMEDHRDDLIVILAGYSYEMKEFLTANSGLKSRFPNIIEFPDYTGQELLDITKSIVKGKGYRLDEACEEPLRAYYEKMQNEGDPRTNGNGRMARNKVEDAILNCSRRNVKAPEEERDLELLKIEDFELS